MAKKIVYTAASLLLFVAMIAFSMQNVSVRADDGDDFDVLIEITGVIESITADQLVLEDDDAVIKINPATQIAPGLVPGMTVVVLVSMDDENLVAKSILLQVAQATTEPTTQATTEPIAQPSMEPTTAATETAKNDRGECPEVTNKTHPALARLADALGVSYDELAAWKCKGYGVGEIAKAYALAKESGKSVEEIFAMRASGLGWGQIIKELGVDGKIGKEKIFKSKGNAKHDNDSDDDKGKGKDKDKDKGNKNKDNSKGNGKK